MMMDNHRQQFLEFMLSEKGCELHSAINCADMSANRFAWEIWKVAKGDNND